MTSRVSLRGESPRSFVKEGLVLGLVSLAGPLAMNMYVPAFPEMAVALETNSEAYLAVVLSLIKLHIRSIWHTITGGKNGLTIWSEEGNLS